jgi:hypothetical protein
METSLPIALLLGLLVLFLMRKGELKIGHAIVAIMLGFFLASTSVGAQISQLNTMIAGMVGADLHP